MMVRNVMLGTFVMLALAGLPGRGEAQVSLNIGINLPAPPSFVLVPGTPVAYAPAVPGNYFFYGGQYYVFTSGIWYVAPRYNGPWVTVAPAYVPLPLLSVPVKYYRVPPPHWKGWRREAAPRWDPSWGHQWKAERGGPEHREPPREARGAPHPGHP